MRDNFKDLASMAVLALITLASLVVLFHFAVYFLIAWIVVVAVLGLALLMKGFRK